ncbi:catecholate siderophore receptor [Sphingobium faniae]|nr:catecholate siderophore receptor [Sphingobium faniae]
MHESNRDSQTEVDREGGRNRSRAFLALSCVGLFASPALAQDRASNESHPRLGGVTVTDTAIDDSYDRKEADSVKFTQPLLDTPRSVTVIPREVIEDRGFTSLTDILRTTPGITMGSGEGGTPMGDRPLVRGYESATDMQIDGLRSVGRFSHEVYNLESVEVVKGPGGALNGRGSTGGAINLVTKKPQEGDFVAIRGTVGTDETKRATVDINHQLADGIAVRLNAMGHDADVAGRDALKVSRWGFSPSIAFGLGGPLRATLSYSYLKTDDIPDVGHPFQNSGTVSPLKLDRDNFYGFANRDFRETEGHFGSAVLEYDVAGGITLRNSTRLARMTNEYIFSRPSFNTTTATPATGLVAIDFRSANILSEGFLNQTDLRGTFETGGIEHSFIGGIEYSKEKQKSRPSWTQAPGSAPLFQSLNNPDPYAAFNPLVKTPFATPAVPIEHETKAAFLFDTVSLSEQLQINLGLRYDDYEVSDGTRTAKNDFWNYQAGIVYKPMPNGSIYISYGTSSNPSGECAGMAGGAEGAGACTLNNNNVNLKPERAKSWELGTKWDLLGEQLSLTAAVFQTKKNNARATDPITGTVQLLGNNRVRGFEFGVSGNITSEWNIFGGYTYLDAKLLDDGAGNNDGNKIKFVAPHSFSLWTTYNITPQFNMGGGVNYTGTRYVNDANTQKFKPYARVDATIGYRVSENLDLRVNVQNLTNKLYYDASHVGIFANVAPGRSALLTANLRY